MGRRTEPSAADGSPARPGQASYPAKP